MKPAILAICFALLLALPESCKKDNHASLFNYEKAAGIWVPYETIAAGGTVTAVTSTSGNLFGVYTECVKLNKDRSFIPVVWIDPTHFTLKENEKGIYSYLPDEQKLVFNGTWLFEMKLMKFDQDELWLDTGTLLYKFKRQG